MGQWARSLLGCSRAPDRPFLKRRKLWKPRSLSLPGFSRNPAKRTSPEASAWCQPATAPQPTVQYTPGDKLGQLFSVHHRPFMLFSIQRGEGGQAQQSGMFRLFTERRERASVFSMTHVFHQLSAPKSAKVGPPEGSLGR